MKLMTKIILLITSTTLLSGCETEPVSDRINIFNQYYEVSLEYAPYKKLIKKQTISYNNNEKKYTIISNHAGQITNTTYETATGHIVPQFIFDYKNGLIEYVKEDGDQNLTYKGKLTLDKEGNIISIKANSSNGDIYNKSASFKNGKIAKSTRQLKNTVNNITINTTYIWEDDRIKKIQAISQRPDFEPIHIERTFYYDPEGRLQKLITESSAINITNTYEEFNQYGDWTKAVQNVESPDYPERPELSPRVNVITREIEYFE